MMRLLQIEWMKLKHYRAFKIFGIFYLAGILGVLFIMNVVYNNIPAGQDCKDFYKTLLITLCYGIQLVGLIAGYCFFRDG